MNDLWTYDISGHNWQKLNPPSFSPVSRKSHTAIYVPATNRMIIFGGESGPSSYLDDTWLYDFSSGTWLEVYTPVKPSARSGASFALNSDRTKGILYGGYNGSYLNDTWLFDLVTEQWQLLSPVTSPPSRAYHMGCGLSTSNSILIFGGQDGSGTLGETWKYDIDSDDWLVLTPPTRPPDISYGTLVSDIANNRCLLFGGINGSNQTWTFNEYSENWDHLSIGDRPPERWGHSAVYDSIQGNMIVFAGNRKIPGNPDLNDLWELTILTSVVPLDTNLVVITLILLLLSIQLSRRAS
jgi:N-acetylneuraminic acid mutarotase